MEADHGTPPWRPERTVDPGLATKLVERVAPRLAPARVEPLGEGFDNTVYLVNGEWVFRFPRREIATTLIETELRVLPRLAGRLPLASPVPEIVGRDDERYPWPFAGHRLLAGRSAAEASLDDAARARTATVLGRFLRALHAVEPAGLDLPDDEHGRLDVERLHGAFTERIAELERRGLVRDAASLVTPFERLAARPVAMARRLTVVHGDLYAAHVLVDDDDAPCGVIDWGDVHRGRPAMDLSMAHGFLPRAAHGAFRAAYGPIEEDAWRLAWLRAAHHTVMMLAYAEDAGRPALLREGRGSLSRLAESAADLVRR